ncbi:hypothetical protein [Methylocapsa sp. S129]|uniref:hypothetical protein n=1 Tax=Methylocapsa sp. S129 TaxID=1641869 RepID=UPI00131B0361|nr:hypothetical protein [Methylocapsa sp. S129]
MFDLIVDHLLRRLGQVHVLDERDKPIQRLCAAGNDAASIMGGNYPGGAFALGPAITFGNIAGIHLAGANA